MGRRVIEAVAAHLAGQPVAARQAVEVSLVTRETLRDGS
jgi:hypothetical protein